MPGGLDHGVLAARIVYGSRHTADADGRRYGRLNDSCCGRRHRAPTRRHGRTLDARSRRLGGRCPSWNDRRDHHARRPGRGAKRSGSCPTRHNPDEAGLRRARSRGDRRSAPDRNRRRGAPTADRRATWPRTGGRTSCRGSAGADSGATRAGVRGAQRSAAAGRARGRGTARAKRRLAGPTRASVVRSRPGRGGGAPESSRCAGRGSAGPDRGARTAACRSGSGARPGRSERCRAAPS